MIRIAVHNDLQPNKLYDNTFQYYWCLACRNASAETENLGLNTICSSCCTQCYVSCFLRVILTSTIPILNVGKPTVTTLYSEQHFTFKVLT